MNLSREKSFSLKTIESKQNYLSREIKSQILLKRKIYKCTIKQKIHFIIFMLIISTKKINTSLENFHSNNFNKIIEKSYKLKNLYKNIEKILKI